MGKLIAALFIVSAFSISRAGFGDAQYCLTGGQSQQQGNNWLIPVQTNGGEDTDLLCGTSSPDLPECGSGFGSLPEGCSVDCHRNCTEFDSESNL